MSKRTNQALTAVRMCRSWKGEDFCVVNGARSSVGSHAKDVTVRAERRLNHAIAAEGLDEAEADWQDYLATQDEEYRAFYEEANAFYAA